MAKNCSKYCQIAKISSG